MDNGETPRQAAKIGVMTLGSCATEKCPLESLDELWMEHIHLQAEPLKMTTGISHTDMPGSGQTGQKDEGTSLP